MPLKTAVIAAFAAVFACVLLVCVQAHASDRKPETTVVSSDIDRFWRAYDRIVKVSDRSEKIRILEQSFIEPGSPGLSAMMERRGYTVESYIDAIDRYPRFWNSVRSNTGQVNRYARDIEDGIEKLRALYPDLKPAKVYFTVGAMMSGGTTLGDRVLIGSELSMADRNAVTDEIPGSLGENLRLHFDTDPVRSVVLLNVHEYVHTQQGPFGADLISVALQEGVAEFVSTLAMQQPSASPAVGFGKANDERVRRRFETEMFSPYWDDWLFNDTRNVFAIRDLGYYVGYAIAEAYYQRASDKRAALKLLIELDYRDPAAVDAVVEASGYFLRPLPELRAEYARNIPRVTEIRGFHNGDANVNPGIDRITIKFSAPMNPRFRGFEFGPLGEGNVLRVEDLVGYSEDRTEMTLKVKLQPGHRHQLLLSARFRGDAGPPLQPYLIDITTTK